MSVVSDYGPANACDVKMAIHDHIADYQSQGRFSWPLDAFCAEWWCYHVQVAWVTSWNDEGRSTPALKHLRMWLETPAYAAAWVKAVEWAGRTDTQTAPRRMRVTS